MLQAARWKYRMQKLPFWHHRTTLSGYIFGTKACIDNRKKNLLNSNTSSTCPGNIVNFGLLTAEICWRVWGTPINFNGFCVLAALLHGISSSGRQPNFAAWYLHATGRPSRSTFGGRTVYLIRLCFLEIVNNFYRVEDDSIILLY